MGNPARYCTPKFCPFKRLIFFFGGNSAHFWHAIFRMQQNLEHSRARLLVQNKRNACHFFAPKMFAHAIVWFCCGNSAQVLLGTITLESQLLEFFVPKQRKMLPFLGTQKISTHWIVQVQICQFFAHKENWDTQFWEILLQTRGNAARFLHLKYLAIRLFNLFEEFSSANFSARIEGQSIVRCSITNMGKCCPFFAPQIFGHSTVRFLWKVCPFFAHEKFATFNGWTFVQKWGKRCPFFAPIKYCPCGCLILLWKFCPFLLAKNIRTLNCWNSCSKTEKRCPFFARTHFAHSIYFLWKFCPFSAIFRVQKKQLGHSIVTNLVTNRGNAAPFCTQMFCPCDWFRCRILPMFRTPNNLGPSMVRICAQKLVPLWLKKPAHKSLAIPLFEWLLWKQGNCCPFFAHRHFWALGCSNSSFRARRRFYVAYCVQQLFLDIQFFKIQNRGRCSLRELFQDTQWLLVLEQCRGNAHFCPTTVSSRITWQILTRLTLCLLQQERVSSFSLQPRTWQLHCSAPSFVFCPGTPKNKD